MTLDSATCPYQLGAPIDLADLLALPPDGHRYGRDPGGNLILMSPDNWKEHRHPLGEFVKILNRMLQAPFTAWPEPSIAFRRVYDLKSQVLPESFLGPKAIEPDVACFDRVPGEVVGPGGTSLCSPEGLRVVIEVLSPSTWKSNMGIGRADAVDRPRTYLEAGVAEYWLLNPAVHTRDCPLPPRSARFLARPARGAEWKEKKAPRGVFRSAALPGVVLDLGEFWDRCRL